MSPVCDWLDKVNAVSSRGTRVRASVCVRAQVVVTALWN